MCRIAFLTLAKACSGFSFLQHTTLTTANEADVPRGPYVVDAFPFGVTRATAPQLPVRA